MKKVFLSILILFCLFSLSYAQTNEVKLYLFWGNGCPHCAAEKEFLKKLEQKYPQLEVKSYEVWYNSTNLELFKKMVEGYGCGVSGVPTTFIGEDYIIGYSSDETTGKKIEEKIKFCIENGCIDPTEKLGKDSHGICIGNEIIELPILGELDYSKMSLPAFTIILGGLDGFNPCAFFVLFFLLSMLVYAKSRKRILLIGGTFVFFSGFVYFLFMAAWLNLFLIIGQLKIITIIAGIIALVMATINIKDFFFFKKGVSLTIPEGAKPKLFKRMRNLLKADSLISMMTGTIVLAIAANTYELLCTAGFPMVFTRVLTLNNLSMTEYYLYLILYNLVYIIPLLIIVLMFTITLGAKKLTEEQGQLLKLISGLIMLSLGLILLINPALLSDITISIGILVLSLIIAETINLLSKKLNKIKGDKNGK
jgi:thiol-disulfide isomerase/thioredoxin